VNGPARYQFGASAGDPAEALDAKLALLEQHIENAYEQLRRAAVILAQLRAELRND
jgi:hypothetical protein